jgi:hypothetical protein
MQQVSSSCAVTGASQPAHLHAEEAPTAATATAANTEGTTVSSSATAAAVAAAAWATHWQELRRRLANSCGHMTSKSSSSLSL